jgi:hypothetical protein
VGGGEHGSFAGISPGRSGPFPEGPNLSRKVGTFPGRSGPFPEGRDLSRKVWTFPGRWGPFPEGRDLSRKVGTFPGRSGPFPEGPDLSRKVRTFPGRSGPFPEGRDLSRKVGTFPGRSGPSTEERLANRYTAVEVGCFDRAAKRRWINSRGCEQSEQPPEPSRHTDPAATAAAEIPVPLSRHDSFSFLSGGSLAFASDPRLCFRAPLRGAKRRRSHSGPGSEHCEMDVIPFHEEIRRELKNLLG